MNLWGRLGLSVALTAIFAMVATAWLQSRDFYEVYRWGICAGLASFGVIAWIAGAILNTIRRNRPADSDDSTPEPFLLVDLSYWGMIFIVFGLVIVFIVPTKKSEPLPVVARTTPKPKKIPLPATNAPVVSRNPQRPWPVLKLQGIAHTGGTSSALINRKTYFVGDRIGEAVLTSIEGETVIVELDCQARILRISM